MSSWHGTYFLCASQRRHWCCRCPFLFLFVLFITVLLIFFSLVWMVMFTSHLFPFSVVDTSYHNLFDSLSSNWGHVYSLLLSLLFLTSHQLPPETEEATYKFFSCSVFLPSLFLKLRFFCQSLSGSRKRREAWSLTPAYAWHLSEV